MNAVLKKGNTEPVKNKDNTEDVCICMEMGDIARIQIESHHLSDERQLQIKYETKVSEQRLSLILHCWIICQPHGAFFILLICC